MLVFRGETAHADLEDKKRERAWKESVKFSQFRVLKIARFWSKERRALSPRSSDKKCPRGRLWMTTIIWRKFRQILALQGIPCACRMGFVDWDLECSTVHKHGFPDPESWLPLAAGASSCNLVFTTWVLAALSIVLCYPNQLSQRLHDYIHETILFNAIWIYNFPHSRLNFRCLIYLVHRVRTVDRKIWPLWWPLIVASVLQFCEGCYVGEMRRRRRRRRRWRQQQQRRQW